MTGVREQLRRGIFGEGPGAALATLAVGAVAIAASLPYDALNHGPNVVFLRTPLDDLIPVVAPLVVPYVSLRPFIYASAVLFLLFRVRIYRSAALAMILTFVASYACYVFLQSYVERPEVAGDDVFSAMIREVYAGDQPYNDFPSLHASLSTLFAIHWWRVDRRLGVAIGIWAALIAVSTVFVKQHYVPDVVAGVALAVVASLVGLRIFVDQGAERRST